MHYHEFVATFLITAKLHFSRGWISVKYLSYFERATWPTFHLPNRIIFDSYPWRPLNCLQNEGFLKLFEAFCKIKLFVKFIFFEYIFVFFFVKLLKNPKRTISKIWSKFWFLHVQPKSKVLQKRSDNLFKHYSPKGIFFTLFCFFLVYRMAQPLVRFGWNFK